MTSTSSARPSQRMPVRRRLSISSAPDVEADNSIPRPAPTHEVLLLSGRVPGGGSPSSTQDASAVRPGLTFSNAICMKMYLVLEDASSSNLALFTNVGIGLFILFGMGTAIAGTTTGVMLHPPSRYLVETILEPICIAVYTLEWIARLLAHMGCASAFGSFWKNILTYTDLVPWLAWYVELLVTSPRDLSLAFRFVMLRLFRLSRIFRAFRHRWTFQLSLDAAVLAVHRARGLLWAMFHLALTAAFLFAVALYFAERGSYDRERLVWIAIDGEESQFSTVASSLWFTFVTMTTTGYGDIVPKTWFGRALAIPVMWMGVVLLALPSIVVGRNFAEIVEHWKGNGEDNKENRLRPQKIRVDPPEVNIPEPPIGHAGAQREDKERVASSPRGERHEKESKPPHAPMKKRKLVSPLPSVPPASEVPAAKSPERAWLEQEIGRVTQVTAEVIATRSTRELVQHIRRLRSCMDNDQKALNFAYEAMEELVEGMKDEYESDEETNSKS